MAFDSTPAGYECHMPVKSGTRILQKPTDPVRISCTSGKSIPVGCDTTRSTRKTSPGPIFGLDLLKFLSVASNPSSHLPRHLAFWLVGKGKWLSP
jgi:hypothetical protein